jgi:hypothetical protein
MTRLQAANNVCRAANLPTGSAIQELNDAPGGGFMVTVKDPEGFLVNLVYGQSPAAPGEYPSKLVVNYESDKPRIRHFQRFVPGPAAVHKVCLSRPFSYSN